jgi:hypothetical protein
LQETKTRSCQTVQHDKERTNSQLTWQQQHAMSQALWRTPFRRLQRSKLLRQQPQQFAGCLLTWLASQQPSSSSSLQEALSAGTKRLQEPSSLTGMQWVAGGGSVQFSAACRRIGSLQASHQASCRKATSC